MTAKPVQFYVKAAFMEIYNEQLRDLLNPSSGILHCRWNVKNVIQRDFKHVLIGFFCIRFNGC